MQPITQPWLKDLRQQLARGETKKVLQELQQVCEEHRLREPLEDIILQASLYRQYQEGIRNGTTSANEQSIALARINQALLYVIEFLSDTETPEGQASRKGPLILPDPRRKKRIYLILATFLLIAVVVIRVIWSDPDYYLEPRTRYQLTVFVHGPGGPQDILLRNEGMVTVDFGNRRDERQIGAEGQVAFQEVDEYFLGQRLGINLNAEGYELRYPDSTYLFNNEPIYLAVQPASWKGLIQGKVLSRDGSTFLSGVRIEVSGEFQISDSLGNFYLELPPEKWQEEYTLYAAKEGYQLKKEKYYPRIPDFQIRLTPKND